MSFQVHPLSGGSVSHIFDLISDYGCDRKYWAKAAVAGAIGFSSAHNQRRSAKKYAEALESLELDESPVFILGHWRSGTTHLHHLLSQDPQFSYVSSYQALAPELFLQNLWTTRLFIQACLPKKRPMDNIKLSLEKPEEEEFVLSNTCRHSFIHTFFFPRQAREIFNRSVLFEGLTESEKQDWSDALVRGLKFSALASGQTKMLLKSPANTARIQMLLEMFPKAKFLHIHRNPYTVFSSQRHTCMKLTQLWTLQEISEDEIAENVLWMYEKMMHKFFEEKSLIPPENFYEVSYETLEENPIATLEAIYTKLNLTGFEQNKAAFKNYLESLASYQKNRYSLTPQLQQRISEQWGFAIRSLGYEANSTIPA